MKGMPTLKDIASITGVSVTTVSKSLKNHPDVSAKRKKQILEIARKINYVPNATARNLRNQKTNLICVIISDSTNPYYASFLKSVEEQTSARDYFTIIFNSNEVVRRERSFLENLRGLNIAGVIITPALDGKESIEWLRKSRIPFVISNRYVNREKDNYVVADDEGAGYIATKYILEKRPDNDVLFFGPSREVSSAKERYSGYERALKERAKVARDENTVSGVFTQEQAYLAARKLIIQREPPYSIVCYSDYIATGVSKALNEAEIEIPKYVSLIGIDNIELFSFIHPSLTTVEIPKEEIGRKSVELLLRVIESRDNEEGSEVQHIVLKPRLIIRESA